MEIQDFFKKWTSTRPNLKASFYDAEIEVMAFAEAYHRQQLTDMLGDFEPKSNIDDYLKQQSERKTNTEQSEQHDSKALHIADVSNCLVKSNYIEKSHEILNKYSKRLNSVTKLAIVESWQDGFEKAIKYISENNC